MYPPFENSTTGIAITQGLAKEENIDQIHSALAQFLYSPNGGKYKKKSPKNCKKNLQHCIFELCNLMQAVYTMDLKCEKNAYYLSLGNFLKLQLGIFELI